MLLDLSDSGAGLGLAYFPGEALPGFGGTHQKDRSGWWSAHHGQHPSVLGASAYQLSQADLAEIDRLMVDAIPVGGPTPEGMT